jgi:DNA-binding NtrC family response regulator
MRRRLLLVEPDQGLAAIVQHTIRGTAEVATHSQFETARKDLLHKRYDFVVTNLRLKTYNGLHLAYLALMADPPARAIVYTNEYELPFAREIQRAGAFYETSERLPYALQAYIEAILPPRDRRDPSVRDRRTIFRGGRRCWDRQPSQV